MIMSVLAAVLLMLLTSEDYWQRIGTIQLAGQEVEDVDTGSERLAVMAAQIEMFRDNPWGCGHFCTTILSRQSTLIPSTSTRRSAFGPLTIRSLAC